MGLLEYQAMLSLRDVANDDVLCTFSNRPRQILWSARAGGMDRTSHTKSHPAGSLSSSQPGGPPCWASLLAFGLIVHNHRIMFFISYKILNMVRNFWQELKLLFWFSHSCSHQLGIQYLRVKGALHWRRPTDHSWLCSHLRGNLYINNWFYLLFLSLF
jgi:hypothetical protein